MIEHPYPTVRRAALQSIEHLRLQETRAAVARRIAADPSPDVRGAAVLALVALDGISNHQECLAYLRHGDLELRYGAIVGLARYGGPGGRGVVDQEIRALAASSDPALRTLAARVLGEVDIALVAQQLQTLLDDDDPSVRRAGLGAAGSQRCPTLWPSVVAALEDPATRSAAAAALVAGGQQALPAIGATLARGGEKAARRRLIRLCGRMGGERAADTLQGMIGVPDVELRTQGLASLSACGYVAGDRAAMVRQQIEAEVAHAHRSLRARHDIGDHEPFCLLAAALEGSVRGSAERVLFLLSFLSDAAAILRAREALLSGANRPCAYALELIETLLSAELKSRVLPLIRCLPPRASGESPPLGATGALSPEQRLRAILEEPEGEQETWVLVCALYTAGRLGLHRYRPAVVGRLDTPDPLVRDTARWSLVQIELDSQALSARSCRREGGHNAMLSTIEKVIILKAARPFADTPDPILAEVASLSEEVEMPAGTLLFEKGDVGNSMYVIVSGKVRIHDGEYTLNELGPRDVLGEMTLLDLEPRTASATAIDDSYFLRLHHEPFLELMADRIEVVRGMVRALAGYLRASSAEVARLSARVQELEQAATARQAVGGNRRLEQPP